jgi:hypothetical protein
MTDVVDHSGALVPRDADPVTLDEYSTYSRDTVTEASDIHAPAITDTPDPISDEMVERVLAVGEVDEPDEVAALRREWPGPEMNRNLGYIKSFLDTYVPVDLQAEIPDSVAMLRLGAHIARQVLHERSRSRVPGKRAADGPTGDTDRDVMLDQATTYRRLRDAAQARGDRRNVLRYDEKERQVLAQLGNAPVVGHGRRTA